VHLAGVLETGVERPGLVEDVDVAGGAFGSLPGFEGEGWVADQEDGAEGGDEGVGEDCGVCLGCFRWDSLGFVDCGEWVACWHAPHTLGQSGWFPGVEGVFFEEECFVLFLVVSNEIEWWDGRVE
jgi:hypothetical protein